MKEAISKFSKSLKAENFVGLELDSKTTFKSYMIKLSDKFRNQFFEKIKSKNTLSYSNKWCREEYTELLSFDKAHDESNKKISKVDCNAKFVKDQFQSSKLTFIKGITKTFNEYAKKSKTLKACTKEFNDCINKLEKMDITSDGLPLLLEQFE